MRRSAGKPCVLIIVENLPVPLDRRVWQEAFALRDAGYEVVVICPRMRGFLAAEEVLEGIQIYRHWITQEARGVMGFLGEYVSALFGEICLAWKAWWRHRFVIIHLCNPPDILFLVAFPFKLLGVRIIYDVHDLWPEMFEAKFQRKGLLYWAVRSAERLTHACANVVIATNDSVKEVALQRGGKSADEVFVVRTAPKINITNVVANPVLKRGRQFLVGYVGVMGNADGVDYILRAAQHLVQTLNCKSVQFLLMGSGPEFETLLRLREQLGVADYVEMPGRVSNDFLFQALQTMDLGVASDPYNSYNDRCTMNKVLEYMAFGKPQVMFDLKEGRASAMEAAIYVPDNSATEMAEAIWRLLQDGPARERMGRLGLQRMQTVLHWDRSVVQLLSAYAKAQNPRSAPPGGSAFGLTGHLNALGPFF